MKKINISFKESELDLYEYVKEQLSPSVYVKQLIVNDIGVSAIGKEIKREKINTSSNNIEF